MDELRNGLAGKNPTTLLTRKKQEVATWYRLI